MSEQLTGDELDSLLSQPAAQVSPSGLDELTQRKVEVRVITGKAGCGKTWMVREEMQRAPRKSIVLCAMTGIAAVNLGDNVATLHSTLGFFDYESLVESFARGKVQRRLADMSKQGVRELVVDEASMMEKRVLDIIVQALLEAQTYAGAYPIRLTLVLDFCQLPPVPDHKDKQSGDYCFNASCWPDFQANTIRLEKNWRQSDPAFLEALNAARKGDGTACLHYLQQAGVEFYRHADMNFIGTTLHGTNKEVERFNFTRLMQINSPDIRVPAPRWLHKQLIEERKIPKEWEHIPHELLIRVGAYVMIKANNWDRTPSGQFEGGNNVYVNGDSGWVEGFDPDSQSWLVKLARNGRTVKVGWIDRFVEKREAPPEFESVERKQWPKFDSDSIDRPWGSAWYAQDREKWVWGAVRRYPMVLGWGTTIHSSQGLSLDWVQVNLASGFLKGPAMLYVAFSRCRTPQGLKLAGDPREIVKKCNVDPRVVRWL